MILGNNNGSGKHTIWLFNIAMENHHFLIGKPSINGPCSMAMLNNQSLGDSTVQVQTMSGEHAQLHSEIPGSSKLIK